MYARTGLIVATLLLISSGAAGQTGAAWSKSFEISDYVSNLDSRPDGTVLVTLVGRSAVCALEIGPATSRYVACVRGAGRAKAVAGAAGSTFIFAPSFRGDGSARAQITKVGADGAIAWSKVIAAGRSWRMSGAATPDGGIVVAGGFGWEELDGSIIAKVDSSGSIEWQTFFDAAEHDNLGAIAVAADGYVAVGASSGGPLIVKVDRAGKTLWRRSLTGSHGHSLSVAVLRDGDYLMAGAMDSVGPWLARIAPDGTIRWQRVTDGAEGESFRYVRARSDGGYVVHGTAAASRTTHVMAFDGADRMLWRRSIAFGSGRLLEGLTLTSDDGVVLPHDGAELTIHKIDASGGVSPCLAASVVEEPVELRPLERFALIPDVIPLQLALTVESAHPATEARQPPQTATCRSAGRAAAVVAATPRLDDATAAARRQYRELLLARRYDELDRIGDELRRTWRTSTPIRPALAVFYEALTTNHRALENRENHIRLLEEWRRQRPASVSAAVATAAAYFAYAAAGSPGTSAIVQPDHVVDWKIETHAARVLHESKDFAAADPEYQLIRVRIAGGRCADFEKVIAEPVIRESGYPPLYLNAGYFLLPRWCGDPNRYRKFAETASAATKRDLGDTIYTMLAAQAFDVETRSRRLLEASSIDSIALFPAFRFDWTRVVRGAHDWMKRDNDGGVPHHTLALLAYNTGDRVAARQMFASPHTRWDWVGHRTWSDAERFAAARKWAAASSGQPFMEISPATNPALRPPPQAAGTPSGWIAVASPQWPPILLRNELRIQGGLPRPFHSFLVRGPNGPVAVTSSGLLAEAPASGLPGAVPKPISAAALRGRVQSWTLAPVSNPSASMPAQLPPISLQETGNHGLVLTVDGSGRPPVTVMEAADPKSSAPRRVYVVGCLGGARTPQCVQTAYGAVPAAGPTTVEGIRRIRFEDIVDPADFVGSPVLDEEGRVFAVLTMAADPLNRASSFEPTNLDAAVEPLSWHLRPATATTRAEGTIPDWAKRIPQQWPKLFLRISVQTTSGRTIPEANATIVQTAAGPVVLTVATPFTKAGTFYSAEMTPPLSFEEIRNEVSAWQVSLPGGMRASAVELVTPSISPKLPTRILALSGTALGKYLDEVPALRVRTDRVLQGEQLFVSGCIEGVRQCPGLLYPVVVAEGGAAGPGVEHVRNPNGISFGRLQVMPRQPLEASLVIGSPVVDAHARLVGVVSDVVVTADPGSPPRRVLIVEDVGTLLDTYAALAAQ